MRTWPLMWVRWMCVLLLVAATGCVYPRRGTSLTPVHRESAGRLMAPDGLWQVTIVGAEIAPRKRGDLHWDADGGAPDPFVRIYRDEELLFETDVIDDSFQPRWDATLPRNVHLPPGVALRVELWDRDTVGADPIGQHRGRGLPPNAMPDTDIRLLLEGGNAVILRVSAPRPHRGVGIEEYELRPDELRILRVAAYSPASRASLAPGDAIVAIGERRVPSMSDAQTASALSMASQRGEALTVRGADGRERTVELDRDFVWLSM